MKKVISVLFIIIMVLIFTGCEPTEAQKTMMNQDVKKQEQAARMMDTVKTPEFNYSVERENIAMRLTTTNNPLTIGWIYPMSAGRVLGRFPVRGKVTSGSKRLTNTEMYTTVKTIDDNYSYEMVPAPDEMGAYGSSSNYVFWFDPAGNYFQHEGDYFYSTSPYQVDVNNGTVKLEIDSQEYSKINKYNEDAKKSYEKLKNKIK